MFGGTGRAEFGRRRPRLQGRVAAQRLAQPAVVRVRSTQPDHLGEDRIELVQVVHHLDELVRQWRCVLDVSLLLDRLGRAGRPEQAIEGGEHARHQVGDPAHREEPAASLPRGLAEDHPESRAQVLVDGGHVDAELLGEAQHRLLGLGQRRPAPIDNVGGQRTRAARGRQRGELLRGRARPARQGHQAGGPAIVATSPVMVSAAAGAYRCSAARPLRPVGQDGAVTARTLWVNQCDDKKLGLAGLSLRDACSPASRRDHSRLAVPGGPRGAVPGSERLPRTPRRTRLHRLRSRRAGTRPGCGSPSCSGTRPACRIRSAAAREAGLTEDKAGDVAAYATSPHFSVFEAQTLEFAEQLCIDVSGTTEDNLAALAAKSAPDELRNFVTAIFVVEFTQRLEMMVRALLPAEPDRAAAARADGSVGDRAGIARRIPGRGHAGHDPGPDDHRVGPAPLRAGPTIAGSARPFVSTTRAPPGSTTP